MKPPAPSLWRSAPLGSVSVPSSGGNAVPLTVPIKRVSFSTSVSFDRTLTFVKTASSPTANASPVATGASLTPFTVMVTVAVSLEPEVSVTV